MRGRDTFQKPIQAEVMLVTLQIPGSEIISVDLKKGFDPKDLKQDKKVVFNVENK